jgi:hypothetical protein
MKKGGMDDLVQKAKIKSVTQTRHYSRFDLENALMGMYMITTDLDLSLDNEEVKAAMRLHLVRCDNIMDIFETMIMDGVIL